MAKDNIIQFPTRHKQTVKEKVDILERRVAEIQMENDIMRSDIEYLHDAIKTNIGELHEILKEISVLAGLEKYDNAFNPFKDLEVLFEEIDLNEDKNDD